MKPEQNIPSNPNRLNEGYALEHKPLLDEREGVERGIESTKGRSENESKAAENVLSQAMPAPAVPQPSDNDSALASTPIITDDNIEAKDQDIIEKEWVDKAKKIINETKEDPRKQSEEVSILKSDYKIKRYGRSLRTE